MLNVLLRGAMGIILLSSCVPTALYKPDHAVFSRMSVAQAQAMFSKGFFNGLRLTRAGTALRGVNPKDKSVHVASFPTLAVLQSASPDFGAVWSLMTADPYIVYLNIDTANISGFWQCGFQTKKSAQDFADALYVLTHASLAQLRIPEDPSVQAAFEKAVELFRAAPEKPTLPEEARKYKVQAEAALGQKYYDDAIELYEKALAVAPWWPEGHFNCALIMESVEDYVGAIREMKRYLVLAPDAPDGRAAQDKVYLWEGKIR